MRIWLLPFRELDNQRVLGQHAEWHAIERLIFKYGSKWAGWEKLEHRLALLNVHETIAVEMAMRGFQDRTPPNYPEQYGAFHAEMGTLELFMAKQVPYPVSEELLERERWELICRCQGKWLGRGEMPPEWEPLLERHFAQGCAHGQSERGTERIKLGGVWVDLCLTCKLAYSLETVNPSGRIWIPLERKVVVPDLR